MNEPLSWKKNAKTCKLHFTEKLINWITLISRIFIPFIPLSLFLLRISSLDVNEALNFNNLLCSWFERGPLTLWKGTPLAAHFSTMKISHRCWARTHIIQPDILQSMMIVGVLWLQYLYFYLMKKYLLKKCIRNINVSEFFLLKLLIFRVPEVRGR